MPTPVKSRSESGRSRNLIRVSETVKRQLWKMAAEQRAESGRAVSMSEVIEQLLARQAGESS